MRTMQAIVAVISIALIPISIILFRNQLALADATIHSAVLNTTAALIAMVPEGLMLLTSTVLAASVVRLTQQHVMVQELYCIETLARVDVLCLDKTGTITEGTMDCKETVVLDELFEAQVPKALASLYRRAGGSQRHFHRYCREVYRSRTLARRKKQPLFQPYQVVRRHFRRPGHLHSRRSGICDACTGSIPARGLV